MSSLFPELEQSSKPAAPPQRSAADDAAARALFAALAGPVDAPDDAEAAASRRAFFFEQPRNRVSRDGIAASVAVTGRFEKALGLPGALRSLKRLVGGAIEFVAEIDGELYSGGLVPPGEPCWKEGRSFGLSHRGELHPQLAEALLRLLKRYDGVPYTALAALVEPEPEDKHMLANDYHESVLYSYAPSVGWRRFFEGSELYRGACGEHGGRVATIEHTDLECIYNQTPGLPRLPTFFATPAIEWDVTENPDAITLQTDIQDRDVVRGADILLDQALLSLVDHPNKPERVIVQAGCTPEVTGDDLHASVARTQTKLGLPVIVVGQHNDPVGAAMAPAIEALTVEPDRALQPTTIGILGLPSFRGRKELFGLLAQAGIEVGAALLPEVDMPSLDRLADCSLFVIHPWERYEDVAEKLAARFAPARVMTLHAPFGPRGTQAWLRAVAEVVGRSEEMEAVIAQAWQPLVAQWEQTTARARQHKLGIIVDHPSWRLALSARRSMGLPLLEALCEIGFEVEILAWMGTGRVEEQRFGQVRVRGFRDLDELATILQSGEVSAWYSELFYDRRLSRSATNAFSMRQLRVGLKGAIETAEELLASAELPFFRLYGRYLGEAFPERADQLGAVS